MNTMLSYPKEPADNTQDNHEEVSPYPHESHIADGGEFLDDGIRMHEQPLGGVYNPNKDQVSDKL